MLNIVLDRHIMRTQISLIIIITNFEILADAASIVTIVLRVQRFLSVTVYIIS